MTQFSSSSVFVQQITSSLASLVDGMQEAIKRIEANAASQAAQAAAVVIGDQVQIEALRSAVIDDATDQVLKFEFEERVAKQLASDLDSASIEDKVMESVAEEIDAEEIRDRISETIGNELSLRDIQDAIVESVKDEIDHDEIAVEVAESLRGQIADEVSRKISTDTIASEVKHRLFEAADLERIGEQCSIELAGLLKPNREFQEMVANAIAKQLVDRMFASKAAV